MSYITLGGHGQYEYTEKRSRFIAQAAPVQTEEEALAFIEKCSREHPDASHHVHCYVLRADNTIRFQDDGEPSGTAGKPALNVLLRQHIFDAVCVISRYFGGTLLGAGGLTRAYAHSAKGAVEDAGTVEMLPCREFSAELSYKMWARAEKTLRAFAEIGDIRYGENITVLGNAAVSDCGTLERELTEISSGTAALTWGRACLKPKEIRENKKENS